MSGGQLKKELGMLDIFSLATGAMISSGLFILPGLAYFTSGPSMIIAYVLAGLLAFTGVLSQAEMVSAMPKAGGTYFFVTRSMGPIFGTIDGINSWFSITLKSSFALVGMVAFTKLVVDIDIRLLASVFVIIFLAINMIGAKEAGRFQIILVAGMLFFLAIFIAMGFSHIDINNFTPFVTNGYQSVFATTGLVFVSYGGLLKIASVAEETKNPTHNIPFGMIYSLVVVVIVYALVTFITTGILGSSLGTTISNVNQTPVTDAALITMGRWGQIALGISAMLAFISTANAGIMSASRYPLALSRDELVPKIFGKTSKAGTPIIALLITAVLMLLAIFVDLSVLVKAASTVIIYTYIFSLVSVIILRESSVENYRPKFKSPLYPWIQIVGILGFIFILFEMDLEAIFISFGLGLVGFLTYWFYGKSKYKHEYAVLNLISKITNREFFSANLETELKNIIRERDDIVTDKFDDLIEDSIIIDIEEKVEVSDLFEKIGDEVSHKIGLSSKEMVTLLYNRENESTTAISPFIAIPHIVIDEEYPFEIVLVRAKKGIHFSEEFPAVKSVFVLMGSKKERNMHLRSISFIAQITQQAMFEDRWLKAKKLTSLRDVILLGKRNR